MISNEKDYYTIPALPALRKCGTGSKNKNQDRHRSTERAELQMPGRQTGRIDYQSYRRGQSDEINDRHPAWSTECEPCCTLRTGTWCTRWRTCRRPCDRHKRCLNRASCLFTLRKNPQSHSRYAERHWRIGLWHPRHRLPFIYLHQYHGACHGSRCRERQGVHRTGSSQPRRRTENWRQPGRRWLHFFCQPI